MSFYEQIEEMLAEGFSDADIADMFSDELNAAKKIYEEEKRKAEARRQQEEKNRALQSLYNSFYDYMAITYPDFTMEGLSLSEFQETVEAIVNGIAEANNLFNNIAEMLSDSTPKAKSKSNSKKEKDADAVIRDFLRNIGL